MARATVASVMANWSPTHLRAPPPNGMKAKSAADSLGYMSLGSGLKPAHSPLKSSFVKVSVGK